MVSVDVKQHVDFNNFETYIQNIGVYTRQTYSKFDEGILNNLILIYFKNRAKLGTIITNWNDSWI